MGGHRPVRHACIVYMQADTYCVGWLLNSGLRSWILKIWIGLIILIAVMVILMTVLLESIDLILLYL